MFPKSTQASTTKCHSLFSKEAVVVTKVDQSLVVERKAAETVSHCKALKTKTYSTIHVGYTVCFTANTFYNF